MNMSQGTKRPVPATNAVCIDYSDTSHPSAVSARSTGLGLALLATLWIGLAPRAQADDGSRHYLQTNLVSDVAGVAANTDPNLVNPWGLSVSPTGAWWVSDNGTGLTTLYDGTGAIQTLVVALPNTPGASGASAPTGTVFNGVATDFLLAPGKPAHFIFAHEEGTITAWNGGTTGQLMVNNSGSASYKGLAIATNGSAQLLYAANFRAGTVDVFDNAFKPVNLGPEAFRDLLVPRSFAPFNVQAIGDAIYVAYAEREAGSIDEVDGAGRGFVDVYSTDGHLQKRLQWGLWFNAPWGVALAPADFGRFSNMLLVGQFGSGKIAAFDPDSGEFRGFLRGDDNRPVRIEGLWALAFGNGAGAGPATSLFFTAGIDDEAHGLMGTLTAIAAQDDNNNQGNDNGNGDGNDNNNGNPNNSGPGNSNGNGDGNNGNNNNNSGQGHGGGNGHK